MYKHFFVRFWLSVRTVLCASGYQCELFCALLVTSVNSFVRFLLPVRTVLCASGYQCEMFWALLVTSVNCFVRFWLPVRTVLCASGYQCELFCALLVTSANCFVRFWLPVWTVSWNDSAHDTTVASRSSDDCIFPFTLSLTAIVTAANPPSPQQSNGLADDVLQTSGWQRVWMKRGAVYSWQTTRTDGLIIDTHPYNQYSTDSTSANNSKYFKGHESAV